MVLSLCMPCYAGETSTVTIGEDMPDGPATAEDCGKCTHMCKMCKYKTGPMRYSILESW